jgi:tRNA/rRNA methyltransferase
VLSHLFNQDNDSRRGHFKLATAETLEPMFDHLKEAMVSLGLSTEGNPERMLTKMRKIFQRAELTEDEIFLMRGFFSRIISKKKF